MVQTDIITALEDTDEIELGTTGRVSHRESTRPVWFVRRDHMLYLLPVTGSASQWYRNILHSPTIHIRAGNTAFEADAFPITDPDRVSDVVDEFRAKYGADQVAAHYPKPEVAVAASLA
jgi:hypothetical protein